MGSKRYAATPSISELAANYVVDNLPCITLYIFLLSILTTQDMQYEENLVSEASKKLYLDSSHYDPRTSSMVIYVAVYFNLMSLLEEQYAV